MEEDDPDTIINYVYGIPNVSVWQIHELPVDVSIDPKFRCRPDFIGPMKHNGSNGDSIVNVTGTSLLLHSIVLLVNNRVATCATIEIFYFDIFATVDFRSGVFGRIQVMEWQCE